MPAGSLPSRFHDDLEAFALPFGAFARRISLFAGTDWHDQLPRDVAHIARQLVQSSMIDPAIAKLPWLAGQLRILQEPE